MESANFYLGLWINYSRGTVLGVTLTTTQQQGNLLIAFTALLIPFVSSRFWRLLCIIAHYRYSSPASRDAIHHQRQVILRNSPSPESGIVSLIKLSWAWRKLRNDVTVYRRVLPVLFSAILCITAFTALGGLSSQITSAGGNEVLLKGNTCGIAYFESSQDRDAIVSFTQASEMAANYAQQCYQANNNLGTPNCDKFVVQTLPTALVVTDADCPFEQELCRRRSASILLDTGYIESDRHLGLNTPKEQAFSYRRVLHCSPIQTEGHQTTAVIGNTTYIRYHYGGVWNSKGNATLDYTYATEDLDAQYAEDSNHGIVPSYTYKITSLYARKTHGEVDPSLSSFIPDRRLLLSDGDLELIFLSGNGVYFHEPMDDDWYRATALGVSTTDFGATNRSVTYVYKSTEAASPLGCVSKFQWCNTTEESKEGKCGPLASLLDALYGAVALFNLTSQDLESSRPISNTTDGTRLIWPLLIATSEGTLAAGVESLASHTLLRQGIQLPLPQNQWQIDVMGWWYKSLAVLQAGFVNTAVGTKTRNLPPLNEYEEKLCRSQKMRTNAYASFSVFGLLFAYTTGALIILVSFAIEPTLAWLSKRDGHKKYRFLEWTSNESLQLLRLAHEDVEVGNWSKGADDVPITRPRDELLGLDISNPKHPVLFRTRNIVNVMVKTKSDGNESESAVDESNTLKCAVVVVSSVGVDDVAEH